VAKAVGISTNRIAEIVNNRRRITAGHGVRGARPLFRHLLPEFLDELQSRYDLKMARRI